MSPKRPLPEVDRVAASRAAVAARRARAAVKADIAAGKRRPLEVLAAATAEPEGIEGRLRITDFLLSIPAIGRTKLGRILEELQISPAKRLGGLGRHQRVRLEEFLHNREAATRPGGSRLIVVAGPTAVGKGTVVSYIQEHYPQIQLSVSATTREPRPGETHGVDYYFVDDAEFDSLIENRQLLEYATVHKVHRYGTPRGPIDEALARGTSVILEIDIQGARQVKEIMPEATLVFLLPPSWDELVRRLVGRGTESPEEQQRRLDTAQTEMAAQDEFDFRIINADVAEAAAEVVDLIQVRGSGSRSVAPAESN
ncbi:guanylate kinase [Mycetocola spongiae]|uniref:guanylate kinase n=1 Tax=Mycetocola spongiae TaxID=2859226 RepID=UPI001CF303F9|nr:guanylate kinase [Mycetocola spongiae]UCR89595.1 guanylate kinase [Mycetocola spongiae]